MLGEKIEASVQLPAEIMTQVTGKQVRVLAITGDKRLGTLPEVPTFKESGIDARALALARDRRRRRGRPTR